MRVKELIKSLQAYNPNAKIGLCLDGHYEDDIYISFICEDNDGNKLTNKTTEQVWLEGVDYCVNCQFLAGNYCTAYQKDTVDVDECFQFLEIDDGE